MHKLVITLGIFIIIIANPTLSQHSDQIQDFTLPNAADGSSFSLSQYRDAKAVVVIFTSFYCPYAKFYEDRVAKLVDRYNSNDIRFLLINPNNPNKSKADALSNIEAEAKRVGLDIPFLSDSSQEVADLLGAEKTPEAFILVPKNDAFSIVYRGAIDDNPQVEEDVKHHYLSDAITAVSQNRPVKSSSTIVTGCIIKR